MVGRGAHERRKKKKGLNGEGQGLLEQLKCSAMI
jgi:hypothetical protein